MINRISKHLRKTKDLFKFLLSCYRNGGYAKPIITPIKYDDILKGKKVLITGGGAGIGFAMAKKFVEEGAEVIITGRDRAKLDNAKEIISSDRLHILEWDISDISSLDDKIQKVLILLSGKIDVVINNAGVLLQQDFFNLDEKTWDKTYAINSKSIYFLSQKISNLWINDRCKGKIINISSTSAFYGCAIPYGMTKWDIRGLTEGLGKKLYPFGIVVNGIAPGRTATQMLGKESNENVYDSKTSAERYCLPEEVAELAIFLISDAANFIVGQTIICDGGYTLKV